MSELEPYEIQKLMRQALNAMDIVERQTGNDLVEMTQLMREVAERDALVKKICARRFTGRGKR